jgi:hypothetical protein
MNNHLPLDRSDTPAQPKPSKRGDHRDRCAHYDHTVGRCQLTTTHRGRHAAALDGAFVTWRRDRVRSWTKRNPPAWLPELPWAPGYEPDLGVDAHRQHSLSARTL